MLTRIYDLSTNNELFSFRREMEGRQMLSVIKEELSSFYEKAVSYIGFKSWLENGTCYTNMGEGSNLMTTTSAIVGGSNRCEIAPVEFEDGTFGPRIGFKTECEGYVLSTGKKAKTIFGTSNNDAYVSKIINGRRKLSINAHTLMNCKKFKSLKEVKKYLEKYADVMHKFADESYGYVFSIERLQDSLPEVSEEIKALLNTINQQDVKQEESVPETATPDNMMTEAVKRMEQMHLMPHIIKRFQKERKVFFSEFCGILYDLNEQAQAACDYVASKGNLPYHVVRTQTEFGDCYSVLYVSSHTEEWVYDRMDSDGYVMSYTYNATDPIMSEFGSIVVEPANGGLERVG